MLGTNALKYLHPDDAAAMAADLQRLMTIPNVTIRFQARYAHADGTWLWLDVVSCNLTWSERRRRRQQRP
ncbi:MAG TPA: PAS domain-containing protein [Actinoplanes sp.]|nr:PAS domain-containing protein [Actinoplanes sp.]